MNAKSFILAGKATFTVTSRRTGVRFTYKVAKKKDSETGPWFVSVLTGPDNENHYKFFGTIFADGNYRYSMARAKVNLDAPSVLGWDWLWANIDNAEKLAAKCDICHCGKCGRCGRKLTVPASVESGFGPECINFV